MIYTINNKHKYKITNQNIISYKQIQTHELFCYILQTVRFEQDFLAKHFFHSQHRPLELNHNEEYPIATNNKSKFKIKQLIEYIY